MLKVTPQSCFLQAIFLVSGSYHSQLLGKEKKRISRKSFSLVGCTQEENICGWDVCRQKCMCMQTNEWNMDVDSFTQFLGLSLKGGPIQLHLISWMATYLPVYITDQAIYPVTSFSNELFSLSFCFLIRTEQDVPCFQKFSTAAFPTWFTNVETEQEFWSYL